MEHPIKRGDPVSGTTSKNSNSHSPSNVNCQEILRKGWGLEIISPTHAGILSSLILYRSHTGNTAVISLWVYPAHHIQRQHFYTTAPCVDTFGPEVVDRKPWEPQLVRFLASASPLRVDRTCFLPLLIEPTKRAKQISQNSHLDYKLKVKEFSSELSFLISLN